MYDMYIYSQASVDTKDSNDNVIGSILRKEIEVSTYTCSCSCLGFRVIKVAH